MKNSLLSSFHIVAMLLMMLQLSLAQTPAPALSVRQLVSVINDKATQASPEQLYIHTDKPNYNGGDTLWFKAYLLNSISLKATPKSGVLYIELANDSNRVMKRMMLPLYYGTGTGNITLDATEYAQGGYVLRGYTNWMRNMPEDLIFTKRFYLSNTQGDDWLINQRTSVTKIVEKQNVKLGLRIGQLDRSAVMLREMQLRITDGRRTLLKSNVQTDLSGIIDVNFDLPDKVNTQALAVSLQDMRKGSDSRRSVIPLIFDRPDMLDLQFMPEGGKLVAGLFANIAFKAINEAGLGTNISGDVYDSTGQLITSFKAEHNGMGAFGLEPKAGERYIARVKLANGTYKSYDLPSVMPSGITLQVRNGIGTDTCLLNIAATADLIAAGGSYYLLGMARGVVCYGASLPAGNLSAGVKIAKSTFPSGVVRFIIADARYRPINERLIYIDHKDALRLKIDLNKPSFIQRDSVALNIAVSDVDGQPVEGSFSLTVTDDGQVNADSLNYSSLVMSTQLNSHLKGTIQTPGYYINASSSSIKWRHLDQLLMTQGWIGYDWTDAFKTDKPILFPAEKEPSITGKVTNIFNKPVANSGVTLFSKKPLLITDTVSNQQGIFTFEHIPVSDTSIYFIQARNKRGKSFNVGIEMDEFRAPAFSPLAGRTIPWFMDLDSTALLSVKRQLALRSEQQRISKGTVLKAVEVKAKKIIKGSKNINGPGEADVIVDEETLIKAGRLSLGDLLVKNVKGFGETSRKGVRFYVVNFMAVKLIIDGIDVEFALPDGVSRYDHIKQYLDYYDAEEIKGIEVMTSARNQGGYDGQFLDPRAERWKHVYVEVTTRGGAGPFMKKAVGTYVYRPLPFAPAKQFYTPKYKLNAIPDMSDIRSTVHWAPNIITDKDGKATVSFYTTDIVGSYTIRIEGTDLNGSIGSYVGKMLVKRGS